MYTHTVDYRMGPRTHSGTYVALILHISVNPSPAQTSVESQMLSVFLNEELERGLFRSVRGRVGSSWLSSQWGGN